jgi:integrase
MGERNMMRKPPRFTHGFIDRHGKARWYFRRRGCKSLALPGLPWSPDFMEAYQRALDGAAGVVVAAARTKPGSISALAVAYYESAEFKQLAPISQRELRNRIERFRSQHGDKGVATLRSEDIRRMLDARADKPNAANNLRKTLRTMMQFAVSRGWRREDPTIGIKKLRVKSQGFRAWGEAEIAQFERKWPIGTRARLALSLLLYTAQRRADVVLMGRQHLRGGALHVRQQKTSAVLEIPVHAALKLALDATPSDHLTFLVTEQGKPFSAAGFTNKFREWCNAAGLANGYSAHGLRKAACRRLAEAGCTEKQIAAISGHVSLSEVQRYTRSADQARLARAAIESISAPTAETRTRSGKPK